MQFAQAPTFAVGEDDLRDVEDDPVIAHVLESPFELHRSFPFEVQVAILYNERIGFKSFHLAGAGSGECRSVKQAPLASIFSRESSIAASLSVLAVIDRLGVGPLSRASPGSRAEQAARVTKKPPSYSFHLHPAIKLRILAPLPTTTPESARLCALSLASIVSLPLPISGRV
jgi:hypothetical protein